MGLITPSQNTVGVLAEFVRSTINQNVGAYSIGPSSVAMERRDGRWLTNLLPVLEARLNTTGQSR